MVPEGEWQDDLGEPYTDGITPVSLVEHFQKKGTPKSAAIAHAAHVTAGLAQDCNRIFETMLNTTATNLCRNAGVRIGTLCTPNDNTEVQGVCECCNRRSTTLWTVPAAHLDNAMKGAVKVMQEKRAENVCRREMAVELRHYDAARLRAWCLTVVPGLRHLYNVQSRFVTSCSTSQWCFKFRT